MEAPVQSIAFFFSIETTCSNFDHKSKSNTSFGTVKRLLYKAFYKISFFPLSQLVAQAHHLVANYFVFFFFCFNI